MQSRNSSSNPCPTHKSLRLWLALPQLWSEKSWAYLWVWTNQCLAYSNGSALLFYWQENGALHSQRRLRRLEVSWQQNLATCDFSPVFQNSSSVITSEIIIHSLLQLIVMWTFNKYGVHSMQRIRRHAVNKYSVFKETFLFLFIIYRFS